MTVREFGTAKTTTTLAACCGALAATPTRMLWPRRPDQRLLASIDNVGVRAAQAVVQVTALTQARQSAVAAVIAEGARRPARMQLGMTTFLIEHPRTRFLVDPAMCSDVHRTVLAQLPAPLRVFVAPDKPVIGLAEILDRVHLAPTDIDFTLPTHLHWDHVSGLLELPLDIPVRTSAHERDWAMGGRVAPFGVARGPLLNRHFDAYELDGPPVLTFERSHDLLGDGSVILVDLAGHTPGSIGILLAVDGGRRILLAGDAIWNGLQASLLRGTAPFPGRLTDADHDGAFAAIHRLHKLPDGIDIVASHDYVATSALSR
ncbi:MBL fold metallo-hydrolase [Streptomyces violaceusniger]|uniref:MBL fold metallo-hydrolase n=1 Tax=Streptomyces violaceusniger TaxID=68280 RepID=UPI000997D522|nr:MBL fold metallo-hydrolase [Streptomyces hygroscopicus]AQW48473.1 hydrolase [Streptomyces hygroscopicus]